MLYNVFLLKESVYIIRDRKCPQCIEYAKNAHTGITCTMRTLQKVLFDDVWH